MPAGRSSYRTTLTDAQERAFQMWFAQLKEQLGRDIDADDPSYDMRGLWKAMQLGAVGPQPDPYSGGEIHFPDTYKTPQHPTQSAESIYAPPNAPTWNQYGALTDQSGTSTLGYIGELIRQMQGR